MEINVKIQCLHPLDRRQYLYARSPAMWVNPTYENKRYRIEQCKDCGKIIEKREL